MHDLDRVFMAIITVILCVIYFLIILPILDTTKKLGKMIPNISFKRSSQDEENKNSKEKSNNSQTANNDEK